ncbi:MAG: PAS domain-containing protein [Candidatus Thermoplasmatota archaeon]
MADVVQELAASPEVRRHLATPNTGVYIMRQDGDIVWASESMQAVTGRSPQDLVDRNAWEVFVPREDLSQVTEFKVRLTDGDGVLWMRVLVPNGSPVWYRATVWVRSNHILCAFKVELDQAEWRPHFIVRPRPKA